MAPDDQEIPEGENPEWQWKQECNCDGGSRTSRERQGSKQILDTVVGPAARLGDTPLMICGDLQHEPRRQSRHLDFALSQGWLTDLGQTHKPVGATQPLHTCEQGDTKTRLDFALVNEAFRAAVTDFEVMQQILVPKHRGLKITLSMDAYEQKVWKMRQPMTLNAEYQQLLEHTFRRRLKQASQEYEQAIMERSSNQPRSKSEAMSRAWRVITDTLVRSMLTQTTRKPKYMQYKGKAPKFFQTTVGGFTKPGKIGEVALQVRQLQNWAKKIAGFRDEWKKEERANHQGGRIALRSRRCDRARWETLVAKGHIWLVQSVKEIGTEMNEQTMEQLVTAVWKGN